MSVKTLKHYLSKFKITSIKDNNNIITHTRIPDNNLKIYGGSYSVPDNELPIFYSLIYDDVFTNGNKEYLTETQLRDNDGEDRPLVIDFDFNYDINSSLERKYNNDTILSIVCLILDKLKTIFDFSTNELSFPVYIFQRSKPYICEKKKCIKDGIHMLVAIKMNTLQQTILREMVLSELANQLEDLPLINTISEVYDSGITNGTIAWQILGCRKPGRESYMLSYYYQLHYNENNNDFSCDLLEGKDFDMKNNYFKLSVKYRDNLKYEMREEFKEIYNNRRSSTPKKNYSNTLKFRDDKIKKLTVSIDSIKNKADLESAIEVLYEEIKEVTDTQYGTLPFKLKELHDITMVLPSKYYDEYEDWIKVGWALYNTCPCDYMFCTWVLFSSQSDKFNYDDISTFYSDKFWGSFKSGNQCLTHNSILYWARQHWKNVKDEDNKLNDILKTSIDYFIQQTIQYPTDFDIARVLYHYAKGKFVCTDIKNNCWYEYRDHRWLETDSGVALSILISTNLHKLYFDEMLTVTYAIHSLDNSDEEWKKLKQKLSALSDICTRLKDVSKKDKLMKASRELFYDKYFYNLIDSNPKLMGFKNGIIDFTNNSFRDGQSNDYVSKSTNINYIPYERIPKQTIDDINKFMSELFPVPDLCEYMWEMLASCLIGNNNNQTFHIYTGVGSNGKSLLMKLMKFVLGEYHGVVPLSVVTEKRPKIGGVSPEIIQLMGTRLAVINEPSAGDKLNEGPMKALTGGDPIQGRYLFKNMVTFVPQFKLAVCTNVLFDINATDNGTWRRIKVVPFLSTFSDNPDSSNEYSFPIDYGLEDKMIKKWVEPFASMLVEIAYRTGGIIQTKCNIVNAKSQEYRNNQDHILNFIHEKIAEEPGERIKKTELCREFDEWFKINYGKRQQPKQKDLYDVMDKKFGKYVNLGWHNVKIIYDQEDEF